MSEQTDKIEIPLECSNCEHEQMVCFDELLVRPTRSNAVEEYGYICDNCGVWELSYYQDITLLEKLNALNGLDMTKPSSQKKMFKAMRKFNSLQRRMKKDS